MEMSSQMETNPIDILAKEIAERLHAIAAKEADVEQIAAVISFKQDEIRKLAEERRSLEQLIQSDRYIISERLGKREKGAL